MTARLGKNVVIKIHVEPTDFNYTKTMLNIVKFIQAATPQTPCVTHSSVNDVNAVRN